MCPCTVLGFVGTDGIEPPLDQYESLPHKRGRSKPMLKVPWWGAVILLTSPWLMKPWLYCPHFPSIGGTPMPYWLLSQPPEIRTQAHYHRLWMDLGIGGRIIMLLTCGQSLVLMRVIPLTAICLNFRQQHQMTSFEVVASPVSDHHLAASVAPLSLIAQ